jgi:acetoin utilization protein AcuB
MIARELISDTIPPVKSTDKLERALEWMGEFKLTQLPIVDDGNFLGIITENDLLDALDLEATVGETRFSIWDSAYAIENQHILELIRVMATFKLDFIPVLDNKNKYLGLVTIKDLVINLGDQFAIREAGSIIVVEVEKKSYVLSEIGRIVESADAKVLNLSLDVHPKTGEVKITLKVNVENPAGVVAAFERFDYRVLETYQRAGDENDSLRNYENLMHFLNL